MRIFQAAPQNNASPGARQDGLVVHTLSFENGDFSNDPPAPSNGSPAWVSRPTLIRRVEVYGSQDQVHPLLVADGAGIPPGDHWNNAPINNTFSSDECICGVMFPVPLEGPGSKNRTGQVGLLLRCLVKNGEPVVNLCANINYSGMQRNWEPCSLIYQTVDSTLPGYPFDLSPGHAGDYWSGITQYGFKIGQPRAVKVILDFVKADPAPDNNALRMAVRIGSNPADLKQTLTLSLRNSQYQDPRAEPALGPLTLSYDPSPDWLIEQTQPHDRLAQLSGDDTMTPSDVPWLINVTGYLSGDDRATLWNRLWNAQRAQLSMGFSCTDPLGGLSFFPDVEEDSTSNAAPARITLTFAASSTVSPQSNVGACWWDDFSMSLRLIGFRYAMNSPALVLTLRGIGQLDGADSANRPVKTLLQLKGRLAAGAVAIENLDASLIPDQFDNAWNLAPDAGTLPPTLDVGAMSPTFTPGAIPADTDSEPVELNVVHSGWYLVPASNNPIRPIPGEIQGLRAITLRLNGLPLSNLAPRAVDPLPDENRLRSPELDDSEVHTNESRAGVNRALQNAVAAYDAQSAMQPLLIPLDKTQGNLPVSLFLNVEERCETGSQRELELRVRARSTSEAITAAWTRILVLDQTPFVFGLIKVAAPWAAFVQGRGTDSDIVAVWKLSSVEGAKWEIASAQDSFDLILPPQALGEAMEKGDAYNAIPPDAPFAALLGEPARLTLRSSYAPSWFSETPWNMRRVLGYAGQRAPGARLINADLELFYGMNASIDASVAQRSLRVSELMARMGAFAPPLLSIPVPTYASPVQRWYRASWLETLSKLVRRLAVYEIWDEGEYVANAGNAPKLATATLKLDRGVTFTLRKGAQVADPILPINRLAGPDAKLPARQTWVGDRQPRDYSAASQRWLPGGAAWGFESDAIYQSVLRRPVSDSGSIEAVFLSALGGWGNQRAAFDKGLTRIYTHTAMGRGTYYALERLGRIGIFWNRAKHVIVYERSVLKGEQFGSVQQNRAGWPLMRKVREYVEILEPQRAFPEGNSARKTRGFVEAIAFVSTIIPVDGVWGHDVIDGTVVRGWEVPLWNPTALDLAQYPRPCIRLVTSGDPASSLPQPTADFADPDKLVFYTSVLDTDTDDTDKWASVPNVDYTNQPTPTVEADVALDPTAPDSMLAPASLILPGLERFTHVLHKHAGAANLIAERSTALLSARVDTVTLMRCNAADVGTSGNATSGFAVALRNGADQWNRFGEHVQDVLAEAGRAGTLTSSAAATLTRAIDDCMTASQTFDTQWQTLATTGPTELVTAIGGQLTYFADDLTARASATIDHLISAVMANRDTVIDALMQWPLQSGTGVLDIDADKLTKLFDSYASTLTNQAVQQLFQEFGVLGNAADSALDDVEHNLDLVASAVQQAIAQIPPTSAALAGMLDDAMSLAKARIATLLALRSGSNSVLAMAIQASLAPVLNNVVQALAPLRISLPAPVTPAWLSNVQAAVGQLRAAVGNVRTTALTAITAAYTKLGQTVLTLPGVAGWTLGTWLQPLQAALKAIASDADKTRQTVIQKVIEAYGAGTQQNAFCQLSANGLLCKLVLFKLALPKAAGFQQDLPVLTNALTAALQTWTSTWANAAPFQAIRAQLDVARQQVAASIGGSLAGVSAAIGLALADPIAQKMHVWGGAIDDGLKRLNQSPTFQNPDRTLRLLRACGEGPIVPGLKFNRKRLAYIYSDAVAEVSSTPAAALVNRVDQDLQALGLRIPFDRMLDRLVPASLENFDLSTIIPDFAGLRNAGMFSGIHLPTVTNDQVAVRQGIDRTTQSAWLKADFATTLAGQNTLFDQFGLTLGLSDGTFSGNASISADIDGKIQKQTSGAIKGDWQLAFGGDPIVTFRDTALSMDDAGHLNFDVKPSNIELSEVFNWLSDVIEAVSDPDAGFTVQLIQGDDGMPVCVRATLDLPCPPIGAGAASVTGLLLGAYFDVGLPVGGGNFVLCAGFNLGRREQPFVLLVSFLGGGGWLQAQSQYTPGTGEVIAMLTLGISAAAGAALNFGPAHGAVIISIGAFVECVINTQGGNPQITIGVAFVVNGEVSLFGIVTVTVTVVLLLTYDGSQIVGSGTLVASVRISFLCTLHVKTGVRYTLAGTTKEDKPRLREAAQKAQEEANRYA